MATNNGGDGSCGDRDSGDGVQGWLLEKGMNEGEAAVASATRTTMTQGSFIAPLELQQDHTQAGTVHVGTSNENGEVFSCNSCVTRALRPHVAPG